MFILCVIDIYICCNSQLGLKSLQDFLNYDEELSLQHIYIYCDLTIIYSEKTAGGDKRKNEINIKIS